jgi:hypothetical protein
MGSAKPLLYDETYCSTKASILVKVKEVRTVTHGKYHQTWSGYKWT